MFRRSPPQLLVLQTDGYRLCGAVVRAFRGKVLVERLLEATAVDPIDAIPEVVAGLRTGKVPQKAVVITHEAVGAVLSLPVDPAAPRSDAEMHEMVRWEIEAFFAQQPTSRRIGEILVGRGHLSHDDVQRVLDEQELSGAGTPKRVRFGDLACQMGLVNREQLQDALAVQERMQLEEHDDCICGWSAAGAAGEMNQHRWLATGLSYRSRERWRRACEDAKLDLIGVYPMVGVSAAALDREERAGIEVVLDVTPGMVGVTRLSDGSVESVETHYLAGQPLTAQRCRDFLGASAADRIWLSGHDSRLDVVVEELTAAPGTEARQMPVERDAERPAGECTAPLAAMVGAARHAMRLAPNRAAAVPGRDPGPGLAHRPSTWAATVAAAGLLALVALEILLLVESGRAEERRSAALARLDKLETAIERVQETIRRVEALENEKTGLAATLHRDRRTADFLEFELPAREQFVLELLDGLAGAAGEEVVVNRVAEVDEAAIEIDGWAMSPEAAHAFARAVAVVSPSWELALDDPPLKTEKGRLGLEGYTFEMRLAPETTSDASSMPAGRAESALVGAARQPSPTSTSEVR